MERGVGRPQGTACSSQQPSHGSFHSGRSHQRRKTPDTLGWVRPPTLTVWNHPSSMPRPSLTLSAPPHGAAAGSVFIAPAVSGQGHVLYFGSDNSSSRWMNPGKAASPPLLHSHLQDAEDSPLPGDQPICQQPKCAGQRGVLSYSSDVFILGSAHTSDPQLAILSVVF